MNGAPPCSIMLLQGGESVEKRFAVWFKEQIVGTMYVCREGLYYRFRCVCDFPTSDLYVVFAVCGKNETNLGICLPQKNGFGFERKLSAKHFEHDDFTFYGAMRREKQIERFIPIAENKPFRYIAVLPTARLTIRNETVGILLTKEQTETQLSSVIE